MGGEAPGNPVLGEGQDVAAETRRKLALVKLVVAVPAFFFGVLGVVVAYRMTGRRLGDAAFWTVLAPILAAFAAFVGHAVWQLRARKPPVDPGGDDTP